jgi:hypothetical protein
MNAKWKHSENINVPVGRPLGDAIFIEKMEVLLDRKLKPQKPGPKKKIK